MNFLPAISIRVIPLTFGLLGLIAIHSFSSPADTLRIVGHVGGAAGGIAVQGNYAFVPEGPYLVALDITSPTAPVRISQVRLPEPMQRASIDNGLAVVTTMHGNLLLVDVRDVRQLRLTHMIAVDGTALGVATSGTLAYVAVYGVGLCIYDVSSWTRPRLRAVYADAVYATDVSVSGRTVFVTDNATGLHIVDASNPSAPTRLGLYRQKDRYPCDVEAAGNLAYTFWGYEGFRILDVSNPSSPSTVSALPLARMTGELRVDGDRAYLAVAESGPMPAAGAPETVGAASADERDELLMIDVAVPSSPEILGRTPTSGPATAVVVANGHALVAWTWPSYLDAVPIPPQYGIHILDVRDPAAPVRRADYDSPPEVTGIDVAGDLALLACEVGDFSRKQFGIYTISVADPFSPFVLGRAVTPGRTRNATLAGNLAWVADWRGVHAFDLADPAAPVLLGSRPVGPYGAEVVAASGTLVLVAAWETGLQILDAANPASTTLLATLATSGTIRDIEIVGNHAYLANSTLGLQIVDIADPARPRFLTPSTPGSQPYRLAVSGNVAALVEYYRGVAFYDVANPSAPGLLSRLDLQSPRDVSLAGDIAFVLADRQVYAFDVSDPKQPQSRSTLAVSGGAVEVVGDRIYLAAEYDGLYIVAFERSPYAGAEGWTFYR